MIGEEEASLWHQAVESAAALDVYLDWLLIHDPVRGELLRRRRANGEPPDHGAYEAEVWAKALGVDGAFLTCNPLPSCLSVAVSQLPLVEPVLDRIPFLQIHLRLDLEEVRTAFESPVVAKIRRFSFTAWRPEHDNYQTTTDRFEFGDQVVQALCASLNFTQLEMLELTDDPGRQCAALVAAYPFVALRELSIRAAAIGDDGALAIASSPIIQTLRRLTLRDSEIGDAGALALAAAGQLEELVIEGHVLGPTGAAALRGLRSLKRLELRANISTDTFESLARFRRYCGEPNRPLADCSTCAAIPESCSRGTVSSIVANYEVDTGQEDHDGVPSQISLLGLFFAIDRDDAFPLSRGAGSFGGRRDHAVLRCPTCYRLYLYTDTYEHVFANTNHDTTYRRLDASALFRTGWALARRLPRRRIDRHLEMFARHEIVRFRESATWSSLDEQNRLVELTPEGLARLIASDPPELRGPLGACQYAQFVGEVEDPTLRVLYSSASIPWRQPLTEEELGQVAVLGAIRIDPPDGERVDDHFVVRSWVVSGRRLICRVVTVHGNGGTVREDAVIAENLPIA